MTQIKKSIKFTSRKRRKILANFSGGDITSNGGVLLLREIDKITGLTKKLSKIISDKRDHRYCTHELLPLLKQRIYAICLGHEDLNDHKKLRKDIALQTAVDRTEVLAGSSTLSRFENSIRRETIVKIHEVFFKHFVASQKKPPKELILDFDATDDLVHGNQEKKFYHGYYRSYCFLPLYVFCGDHLLVSYLRPANIDGAKHSWAILSLLVKKIRKIWTDVKIIFRGDGGFARHKMFDWCEKNKVFYVTGFSSNCRLQKITKNLQAQVETSFNETQEKQKEFDSFLYAAQSWSHKRRVIVKAEYNINGKNTRYVVTNLNQEPKELYENIYCARGDMENRIKEQQLCLFADRTSCHKWDANQFRVMLSSIAYLLMNSLRQFALKTTQFARAQCNTITLKLLKIGAIIIRNTRKIKFLLSSAYPYKNTFENICAKLVPK